jgi:hypothetical protein
LLCPARAKRKKRPEKDEVKETNGTRILVVGDAMLDEYLWGTVRRICPEAPVPIVESRDRSARPGGAANSAANIAALGATAWPHGVTGTDHAGESFSAIGKGGQKCHPFNRIGKLFGRPHHDNCPRKKISANSGTRERSPRALIKTGKKTVV